MVEISTSILSVKKGEESQTFFALEKAHTDYFHIDVMDGKFVEKDTYKKNVRICIIYKKNIKFTTRRTFNGGGCKFCGRRLSCSRT